MNNIIDLQERKESVKDCIGLGLALSKQASRDVLINKVMNINGESNKEIIELTEVMMVECAYVANDISFLRTKERMEIEDPVFKTGIAEPLEDDREAHYAIRADEAEIKHIYHTSLEASKELFSRYCTILNILRDEKSKLEKRIEKGLLSEKSLKGMEEFFKQQGVQFNKSEVKKLIKDTIKEQGVVYLLELGFIG